MSITQYDAILHNTCQYVSILHMLIRFHAALDGQNRLKFYWIDLIDSARRQLEDPAFAGKLYHQFEQQDDGLETEYLKKPI